MRQYYIHIYIYITIHKTSSKENPGTQPVSNSQSRSTGMALAVPVPRGQNVIYFSTWLSLKSPVASPRTYRKDMIMGLSQNGRYYTLLYIMKYRYTPHLPYIKPSLNDDHLGVLMTFFSLSTHFWLSDASWAQNPRPSKKPHNHNGVM